MRCGWAWATCAVLGAGLLAAMSGCMAQERVFDGLRRTPATAAAAGYGTQAIAEFDEAVAMVARLEYAPAAAKFQALLPVFQRAGDADRAAESLFWIGYCYEKLDQAGLAAQFYRQVLQDYPRTPAASQAAARLPGTDE